MNGVDVALYDLNQNLLYPKECTDIDMEHDKLMKSSIDVLMAAHSIYTFLLMRYQKEHLDKRTDVK